MDVHGLAHINHRMWIDVATRELIERYKLTIVLIDHSTDGMFCLHTAANAVVLMLVSDVFNPVQFGK